MSNSFYEDTLLKEEYKLVALLQQDAEFNKYVKITYEDRIDGEERDVTISPNGVRFPEKYTITYNLPVYISPGQLRKDWSGKIVVELSEKVLTSKRADLGPYLKEFRSNFCPFNNHVTQTRICDGNAWAVAKDHGLWHYIISLGALINQDEFVTADGSHFDGAAYNYWITRGRKPVTNIKWPLDLASREEEKIIFIEKKKLSGGLNIVPKTTPPKINKSFTITEKEIPKTPVIKFTERKK
jgi:hypothetical protein